MLQNQRSYYFSAECIHSLGEVIDYHGEPFRWYDPPGRRAELDAYYARLYGLTRDELRYARALRRRSQRSPRRRPFDTPVGHSGQVSLARCSAC